MFSRVFGRPREKGRPPRLSVVVPVYNVEAYLAECLDSILGQDFTDLEVVVVNDGSTDGSAAVAADYARRFPNVEFFSSSNQGLGAARNLGVSHSQGEYLAFADSDDLVPAHGHALLVSTLAQSGSDFAVGSLHHLRDGNLIEPPFLRHAHRQRRLGITIDDLPEVMRNVFAWNKVFSRSFWDRTQLAFPRRVRYEDQVAMTEAYLRADAFDVVREPVYIWRVRADGSSITQRRHELADLDDRIRTKQMTSDIVASWGSARVQDFWARNGLGGDLPLYFRNIISCSDEYWRRLVSGVEELFAGKPPIWESQVLRVQQRVVAWFVAHDRRREAEVVVRWLDENTGALPLRTAGGHVTALLPFHDDEDSDIPPAVFWLSEHELTFDARLFSAKCTAGVLELAGAALIRGAPTNGVTPSIKVALCSDTGQRVEMDVEQRPSPDVTRWISRLPQRYDGGGFGARVHVEELRTRGVRREGNRWHAVLSVDVAGIHREGPFRSKAPSVQLPSTGAGDVAVRAAFVPDSGGLVITVAPGPP